MMYYIHYGACTSIVEQKTCGKCEIDGDAVAEGTGAGEFSVS